MLGFNFFGYVVLGMGFNSIFIFLDKWVMFVVNGFLVFLS